MQGGQPPGRGETPRCRSTGQAEGPASGWHRRLLEGTQLGWAWQGGQEFFTWRRRGRTFQAAVPGHEAARGGMGDGEPLRVLGQLWLVLEGSGLDAAVRRHQNPYSRANRGDGRETTVLTVFWPPRRGHSPLLSDTHSTWRHYLPGCGPS